MWAKLSLDPDFSKNFGAFIGLAPAAFAGHQGGLVFKIMIDLKMEYIWLLLGIPDFLVLSTNEVDPILG